MTRATTVNWIQIKLPLDGKNVHFTRIKRTLWEKLDLALEITKVQDRTKWIKGVCLQEYGIELISQNSLKQLEDAIANSDIYVDISDWLSDKIRHYLDSAEKANKLTL